MPQSGSMIHWSSTYDHFSTGRYSDVRPTTNTRPFSSVWPRHYLMRQDGWLLNRHGQDMQVSSLPIPKGATTHGETLKWDWHDTGILHVTVTGGLHITAAKKRAWRRLRVALVYNFPHILYRPPSETSSGRTAPRCSSITIGASVGTEP